MLAGAKLLGERYISRSARWFRANWVHSAGPVSVASDSAAAFWARPRSGIWF